MLNKCANPACEERFRYWREGRLVVVRHGSHNHERLEYFWFCAACAADYEVVQLGGGHVGVQPVSSRRLLVHA